MGEEVNMMYGGGTDDDERVVEWEDGLPNADDLTPLSQPLIPPELASAFSISPVQFRSPLDVDRASQNTLSSIRGKPDLSSSSNNIFKAFNTKITQLEEENEDKGRDIDNDGDDDKDPMVVVEDEVMRDSTRSHHDNNNNKIKRVDMMTMTADEEAVSMEEQELSAGGGGRASKRARLVWTPQLHKRFVEVVSHLGINNAVPKTIMQLMNVEGLTRENVASHLQKYRLYLKRMSGSGGSDNTTPKDSSAGPASTNNNSVNNSNANNGHVTLQVYPHPGAPQPMMQMPYYGLGYDSHYHPSNYANNMMMHPSSNWSSGNNFGSVGSYPRAASNDN